MFTNNDVSVDFVVYGHLSYAINLIPLVHRRRISGYAITKVCKYC